LNVTTNGKSKNSSQELDSLQKELEEAQAQADQYQQEKTIDEIKKNNEGFKKDLEELQQSSKTTVIEAEKEGEVLGQKAAQKLIMRQKSQSSK